MIEGRAARMRILNDIAETQRQTTAILNTNDAQKRLAQFQGPITWLGVDDRLQETERWRRSAMKHSGTFGWIEQAPEMKAWLRDDCVQPVLWLNGKPGAGI